MGMPGRKGPIGGKIILKWVLEKYDWVVWDKLFWLRIDVIGLFLCTR
jgi:hypothetical protein